MRSLERQLGTPLVHYEHRSVRLTPEGEMVYATAKRMLQEQEHLLRSLDTVHEGQVKFGASMAFEQRYFMERVILPFRTAQPGVLLSVHFGRSVKLAEAVRDGQLDLGYVLGWHIPRGVHFERLHEAEFTFLVARDHWLASRDSVDIAEISQAGLIASPLDDVEWAHYQMVLVHNQATSWGMDR